MIWENGIKTCIISYKKWITSPGSMQDTGSLGLVHWDDPEGWYGEGGGRVGFRIGNTCTPMADACWCMAKPIQYCKVKKNNNKKKKLKRKEKKNVPQNLWDSAISCLYFFLLWKLHVIWTKKFKLASPTYFPRWKTSLPVL